MAVPSRSGSLQGAERRAPAGLERLSLFRGGDVVLRDG